MFVFFFSFFSGIRVVILQLVNSKGDVTNCKISLQGGLVLQNIVYCHDLLYEKIKNGDCGTNKISPSTESYFEIEPPLA